MEQSECKHHHCQCEGDCLGVECHCFMQGKYCGSDCNCPNCHNKPEFEHERVEAFRKILVENPRAFTSEESFSQEDFTAFSSFAMLTNSVDTQPFRLERDEKPISKVLTPKVLEMSIVTVLSAANEALFKVKDQKSFDEEVENLVASEFNDILQKIKNSSHN